MATLQIGAGKKQKLRPGDILGALTSAGGIAVAEVGKITIGDSSAFVAVGRRAADAAMEKLSQGKLNGRSFRVRLVAVSTRYEQALGRLLLDSMALPDIR